MTPEIAKSIEDNPMSIIHIDNPSKEMQLLAVTHKPAALACILRPHAEVIDYTLKRNGDAIVYIKDPTAEQQLLALGNDKGLSLYLHYPENSSPFKLPAIERIAPGFTAFFDLLLDKKMPLVDSADAVVRFCAAQATPVSKTAETTSKKKKVLKKVVSIGLDVCLGDD